MNVSRHISIDEEHFEKIKPYLDKYNGNFGAAIRELVNQVEKCNSISNSSVLDGSLFNWMLKEIDNLLVPDEVLYELIDPAEINSMGKLEAHLNRKFGELEWDINLSLKYDNDLFPHEVLIEIMGSPQKIKFAACIISQYLVNKSLEYSPLRITSLVNFNEYIKIELSGSNKKEAIESLLYYFGGNDMVIKTIRSQPDFWKAIIIRHLLSNYNMVTVHRNYFEDLLAGKVPGGEIIIETLAKKPIQDIPLEEMLYLIKEVYETSRVVERVDFDKDTIILFHNYRNKEAIEKLKKSIVTLLETNGHLFSARLTTNLIVLTHRPDVGKKINEIVDNLKTSNNKVDQELLMFMTFLKGLKDIPDIPLSLTALGRRTGKSLMQEYEKENDIKDWDLESFQMALQTIDSRLHRESEWRLEGKNLLYTIRKCNIVTEGSTIDKYVCHTARETFKGAMNYAFGNRAELNIKKLLTHGDKFCQVIIQML